MVTTLSPIKGKGTVQLTLNYEVVEDPSKDGMSMMRLYYSKAEASGSIYLQIPTDRVDETIEGFNESLVDAITRLGNTSKDLLNQFSPK